MGEIRYRPFAEQARFHRARSKARIRGAFAGKRGGKTEAGAVESIVFAEQKIGYVPSPIDPYLGAIIAPTNSMLRRLSLQKLKAYAGNMIVEHRESHGEIDWHNGTRLLAISADNPQRLEGIKANFVWIDEVFQVSEFLFLEALARVSDTEGQVFCTGSLGVNFNNPKAHWAYKYFKENPLDGSLCFEWPTAANPYFPKNEITRLRNTLDPRTFRQMFELDWSVPGSALVYEEFDDANLCRGYVYNPALPTYVVIDWGWNHPMACLFIQHDPILNKVIVFDEIVKSKLKIEALYNQIMAKGYNIRQWICDIAGNQEREQTGISNVEWFKGKGIKFYYRQSAVAKGISIVRSFIRNGKGEAKLVIDEVRCPKTVDCLKNYSYPEKDGVIISEDPLKKDDDPADALRYYFVNKHDTLLVPNEVQLIPR